MGYSYDKLWKLLIDKKMNREELKRRTGISSTTLARMSKEENVSLAVLAKICDKLDCDIGNIIEYKRDINDRNRAIISDKVYRAES